MNTPNPPYEKYRVGSPAAAELSMFVEEAEMILNGVRGGLLLIEQTGGSPYELEIPLRRVKLLRRKGEEAGVPEITARVEKLESAIAAIITCEEVNKSTLVMGALDLTARIEAQLAEIRMKGGEIFEDVSYFVEESFESLRGAETESEDLGYSETNDQSEDEFEIDRELLDVFAAEAEELLQNIKINLEKLAANIGDREALWEIRRNAHTFKGAAGVVGLKKQSELAHRIEDLLDRVAESKAKSNVKIFNLLLVSTDLLDEMTASGISDAVARRIGEVYREFDYILETISPAAEEKLPPATDAEPECAVEVVAETAADDSKTVRDEAPKSAEKRPMVRVSLDRLDELAAIVRELVIGRALFTRKLAELETQIEEFHNISRRLRSTSGRIEGDFGSSLHPSGLSGRPGLPFSSPPPERKGEGGYEQFDSLEFDRYSEFHQAARELAETSSDALEVNSALDSINETLISLFERHRRLTEDLSEKLSAIRFVLFGALKTRFERAVRVTCDETGKKAEMILENGDLEIDSQIIDGLIEPMMHLLKNAVVHGIEPPETRRLLGKPESGRIVIRLSDEGTHFIVTVADDGGGIAVSALREKAYSTGLIDRRTADAMSEDEAIGLIFHPGLTTAGKLSLSAGRGVGMSIVRESLDSIRGSISVETEPRRGTKFTIRIPGQMAVANALIVEAARRKFAVPFNLVRRIFEVRADVFATDKEFAIIDEKRYPIRRLSECLGLSSDGYSSETVSGMLIESAGTTYAFALDGILRPEEVIIKQLPKPLDRNKCLIGAASLGNGELVPILDMPYLATLKKTGGEPLRPVAPEPIPDTVMIVDDSPSVRLLTKKVVENAGWGVVTAKDGQDAIEQLQASDNLPKIILTDVEMPRMDGYALVRHIRDTERFSKIPVIMITSRSGDKHRQQAFDQGVSKYLTKPFGDAELLGAIDALVQPSLDAA